MKIDKTKLNINTKKLEPITFRIKEDLLNTVDIIAKEIDESRNTTLNVLVELAVKEITKKY